MHRLKDWWKLWQGIFGSSWLTISLTTVAAIGFFYTDSRLMKLVGVWMLGYGLCHGWLNLNIYDRYVLLLVPLLILGASFGVHAIRQYTKFGYWIICGFSILLMLPSAWGTANGRSTVASDRGKYYGIIDLAEAINQQRVWCHCLRSLVRLGTKLLSWWVVRQTSCLLSKSSRDGRRRGNLCARYSASVFSRADPSRFSTLASST